VSRATLWKSASDSFHSTLAFSIQEAASRNGALLEIIYLGDSAAYPDHVIVHKTSTTLF